MLKRRGKQVYGEFEEAGRYYRCKNCGFVCDTKRDALTDYAMPDTDEYGVLLLEDGNFFLTEGDETLQFDSTEHVDIVVGCPFCGCPTYK